MEIYGGAVAALALTCAIPVVMATLSGMQKGKAGLVSGPVADARDDNPLFRIDRAHLNAVESIPGFVALAVLAMMAGVGAGLLSVLCWIYLAARIGHIVVYVRGGPMARGGSLRSMIHLVATIIALVLVVLTVIAALT